MRILLIGHNGQVGWELQRTLACLGDIVVVDRYASEVTIDLRDEQSIRQTVAVVEPDLIVNAAAYTAVDKAETDIDTAKAVNAVAPGVLAQAAAEIGAAMVHYSTDYVFPGIQQQPYLEDSEKGPQNVYGETKLQGELAVQEAGIPHFIVRTSWVYGRRGKNFLLTMLRLMRERESFGVVDDQLGSPTNARQIAEATAMMIAQSMSGGQVNIEQTAGVYHMTCAGQVSWFGFAEMIRELALRKGILPANCATIHPIDSNAFRTEATRPQYSVLDNHKLKQVFDVQLPEWQQALELCLQTMSVSALD